MYATHAGGRVYPLSTDPYFTAVLDIAVGILWNYSNMEENISSTFK